MAAKEKTRVERWTYIGKRASGDTSLKVRHAWLDEKDEERWYGKNIAPVTPNVGAIYEVHCTDKQVTISGDDRPRYVESLDPTEDIRVSQWEAAHLAAETMLEQDAQARKAAREYQENNSPFHAAVGVLGDEYGSLKTSAKKAAFLARAIHGITNWRS